MTQFTETVGNSNTRQCRTAPKQPMSLKFHDFVSTLIFCMYTYRVK